MYAMFQAINEKNRAKLKGKKGMNTNARTKHTFIINTSIVIYR